MKRSTVTIDYLRGGFLALLFMLAGASGVPAVAHPHAWIDLRSTVVLDAQGRVVAIEQQWLFDEFYTAFALDGQKTLADDRDPRLVELARVNLENLRPYGYFTEVRADGAKVTLGTVKEFETALRCGRLWLRFIVPLDRPLDPRKDRVNFSVFDPTYYIEMLHLKDDVIAFHGVGANACYGRITPPNPTTETVMLAAALDRGAKADNTLGALFAETVEVQCQ
ncbi:MAG: DUF1007 family protein [Alphaproteobacteria bacterium]|nr:DUF1007 family protein [Alphaproteobacteria bacterium]